MVFPAMAMEKLKLSLVAPEAVHEEVSLTGEIAEGLVLKMGGPCRGDRFTLLCGSVNAVVALGSRALIRLFGCDIAANTTLKPSPAAMLCKGTDGSATGAHCWRQSFLCTASPMSPLLIRSFGSCRVGVIRIVSREGGGACAGHLQ